MPLSNQTERNRVENKNGRILKPLFVVAILIGLLLTGLFITSGNDIILSLVFGMFPPLLGASGLVQVLAMFGVLTRLDAVEDDGRV